MKNRKHDIAAQYDALAEIYDKYFSDISAARADAAAQMIAPFASPPAKLLDCACGAGHIAVEFARRGYKVRGIDVSKKMIQTARHNARQASLPAKFSVADFAHLPERYSGKFDVVICLGNAFGHNPTAAARLLSLQGFYRCLKPGGGLLLDTRCWENYRRERVRFDAFRGKIVDGEQLVWLNVRDYPPRFSDPHLIEVVIISVRNGETSLRTFEVTYYPFRVAELKRALNSTGFKDIQTTFDPNKGGYYATARKPE